MIDRSAKRLLVVGVLLVLVLAGASASHHRPEESMPGTPSFGLEAGGHLRLLLDFGNVDALASYAATYENDREAVRHALMAGGYYRIHQNLKVGAFYQLGLGQRHDDDWIESGEAWFWRDTGSRFEHSFILDATPRFLVPFLPGDWVFALKSRYELSLYNEGETVVRNTALIRPGLTWFLIDDREPVVNVGLAYTTYLSLDFGATWWYRHGPYLNVIYHATPFLLVDLSLGTQWIYWSESADFVDDFADATYDSPIYRPWTVNVGLIYRPRS